MTRSEFEEKSYEIPLCVQLFDSHAVFSPGQVFENLLGFDVSGMVTDPLIWKDWDIGACQEPCSCQILT